MHFQYCLHSLILLIQSLIKFSLIHDLRVHIFIPDLCGVMQYNSDIATIQSHEILLTTEILKYYYQINKQNLMV